MDCGPLDTLSYILEQIDYKFEFLIGVVYRLTVKDSLSRSQFLTVLHNPQEIQAYLKHPECDIIVLTCPKHLPIFWDHTERGWEKLTEVPINLISEDHVIKLLLIALS